MDTVMQALDINLHASLIVMWSSTDKSPWPITTEFPLVLKSWSFWKEWIFKFAKLLMFLQLDLNPEPLSS